MGHLKIAYVALGCITMAGCAQIDFGNDGLLYYEPVPYLFVSNGADCTSTATLVMLPGEKKHLKFVNGYGSAQLSAELNSGMISKVGQIVDNRVAETVTSLAALRTAAGAAKALTEKPCPPSARLYPSSTASRT